MNQTAKQQLSRNPQNAGYSNPIKTYPVPAVTNEDGTISVPAQPVYLIDPNVEPIPMGSAALISSGTKLAGTLGTYPFFATAIGASGLNLIFCAVGLTTVPQQITADVVCTGTAGNRVFVARILDASGNVVWMGTESAITTAGQTCGYDVNFGGAAGVSTTVRRNMANTGNTNVQVRENCGPLTLGPGYLFLLDDTANIDNADLVTSTCLRRVYSL